MVPKFRNFFTSYGEGGRSYAYLCLDNQDKNPQGLGFGGDNFRDFRIWLDKDLFGKSYVRAEDRTYEKGYLVEHYIEKLKVLLILNYINILIIFMN